MSLAASAAAALVASCNVHELSHAAAATALRWDVARVNLCLPSGGSVEYARTGAQAGNLEGYAGGLGAAGFLVAAYALVFARRARPLDSPFWWAAGVGVVAWIGLQILIGLLEGFAGGIDRDYTELFADHPSVLLPLAGAAVAAGVVAYARRWRAVWER